MSIIGLKTDRLGTDLNDGQGDEWTDSLISIPINRVLATDVNQRIVGIPFSLSAIPSTLILRDSFAGITSGDILTSRLTSSLGGAYSMIIDHDKISFQNTGYEDLYNVSLEADGILRFSGLLRSGIKADDIHDLTNKEYVDTKFNQVQSTALDRLTGVTQTVQSDIIFEGPASDDKFIVKDQIGNKIFWVDTINDRIIIGGSDSQKIAIYDTSLSQTLFIVDTNLGTMRFGNSSLHPSLFSMNYFSGVCTSTGSFGLYNGFRAENTGSSLEILSSYDNNLPNKVQSSGGSGLLISSDNAMVISSPLTSFDIAQQPPRIQKNPADFTSSFHIVNKVYVDDRCGGICSGITNSPTALGNVVGDQSLNPTSFLPSPSPTVPPNYFKAGQSYQLTMAGTAVYTNTDAFVISLKSGAVILGSISIVVPVVAGGGQTWELEADFTIRSISLGLATIVCSFDYTYNDGQDFRGKRSITTSTTLNTTISNTLQAVVNFSSGQATDNITTQLYILKKTVDV